jgi:hypothetical protein
MKKTFEQHWGHERNRVRNGKSIQKAIRCQEAEARQKEFDKLSPAEKASRNSFPGALQFYQKKELERRVNNEVK